MNNLSSSVNSVEWRRTKVQELASQGYNQSEISSILQISQPTINRDITYLRQQAKTNIKRYIDERLPEEYEKCLVGLNAITKEAWNTAYDTEDKREKIQALSLAKECYSMRLDLLTNATVIDDAIRFVSQRSKEKVKSDSDSNEDDKEESNEPDFDDDEDQLEEEQEEETGEISNTTNQVF
jgi:predicted transcriptional regulator